MSAATPGPWHYMKGSKGVFAGQKAICTMHGPRGAEDATRDANTNLVAAAPELLAALDLLLSRNMAETCQHTETHRGGAIWEICDRCGMKWADDMGGKPEWRNPVEWDQAQAAIDKATGVTA